jgi:hypothetical protein
MNLSVIHRGRTSAAAMLTLGALALVACSSSTKATTATVAPSVTTSAGATAGSSASGQVGQLQALTASVQAAEHGTFKAGYTSTSSTGASSTVTFEQQPPKSVFTTAGESVINDGTKTYVCSASGGSTCVAYPAGAANPLAALFQVFSPATAISAMQRAQTELAARTVGYNVSFSSATYAGQASTCISGTGGASNFKYCVTKSGILAYGGANGSSFALTSYSSVVSDSDFSVPAGATIVTLPGGG